MANINYIYFGSNQVWPSIPHYKTFEKSYDFRGGSLAGLQAAGGNGVYTTGSYTIDSGGLGQTGGSNDRVTGVWFPIESGTLDTATKITVRCMGYWIANSWSNDKECGIDSGSNSDWTNDCIQFFTNMNTTSPSSYSTHGIVWNGSEVATSKFAGKGGETTITGVIDLVNKKATHTESGATSYTVSYNLTDSNISSIRKMTRAYYRWERGYSNYNSERLRTIYLKVEY